MCIKMKTVSLLIFSQLPNPLLKYEVAFCGLLVHSLPAPIDSQIGREKYLLRSIISFLTYDENIPI